MNKNRKEYYLEREISWMYFNYRLLKEAQDDSVPLFERLKFLGIYSNNLDEFFRVRVALLNRIINIKDNSLTKEKKEAEKILSAITELNKCYTLEFETAFDSLKKELATQQVFIFDESQISENQKKELHLFFSNSITPVSLSAHLFVKF